MTSVSARASVTALALGLLLAVLTGCGGDGDTEATGPVEKTASEPAVASPDKLAPAADDSDNAQQSDTGANGIHDAPAPPSRTLADQLDETLYGYLSKRTEDEFASSGYSLEPSESASQLETQGNTATSVTKVEAVRLGDGAMAAQGFVDVRVKYRRNGNGWSVVGLDPDLESITRALRFCDVTPAETDTCSGYDYALDIQWQN